VPVLNWLIGVTHTAPVLNLGIFLGRPARLIIFWRNIKWRLCVYYAPAAIVGAWIGALLFKRADLSFLQILVGLFLISTVFQFRFGKTRKSFEFKEWYFIPLGLIVSVLGTMIGALGPVLNPFYLNAGLDKEALIATKTANSFFTGLAQISSYTFFGLLTTENWVFGITLGFGATLGSIIGKGYLKKIKSEQFRILVIAMMVISGVIMIVRRIWF
ncbi:MAG: sulfite exporter TauE/SafE family protein, partial [Ekhidna sp.]